MDDPRTAFACPLVIGQPHSVDELGLPGEIDVIGAGGGAGRDEWFAVEGIRTDRSGDDLCRLRHLRHRLGVSRIGLDQYRDRDFQAGNLLKPGANGLELLPIAPDQRPVQSHRPARGEIPRGQSTREPGRPEEREVVSPPSLHSGAF
jgi:hypothetical protein